MSIYEEGFISYFDVVLFRSLIAVFIAIERSDRKVLSNWELYKGFSVTVGLIDLCALEFKYLKHNKAIVKFHAIERNKSQHCCVLLANNVASVLSGPKTLNGFKLYATSANIVVVPCKRTQHIRPNNVACCWPTMLRLFVLSWPKSLTGFKLCETSANIVVVPCKRTQHVGPNNVASVCTQKDG